MQTSFLINKFRNRFDIILPQLPVNPQLPFWKVYPNLVPITRKYLLSFHGDYKTSSVGGVHGSRDGESPPKYLVENLSAMGKSGTKDQFLISFKCDERGLDVSATDWCLCGSSEQRLDLLEQSTFSLVLGPSNRSLINTRAFTTRIQVNLFFCAIFLCFVKKLCRKCFHLNIQGCIKFLILPLGGGGEFIKSVGKNIKL